MALYLCSDFSFCQAPWRGDFEGTKDLGLSLQRASCIMLSADLKRNGVLFLLVSQWREGMRLFFTRIENFDVWMGVRMFGLVDSFSF